METFFAGVRGIVAKGDVKEREDGKPGWVCHVQLESRRRCCETGPAGKKPALTVPEPPLTQICKSAT